MAKKPCASRRARKTNPSLAPRLINSSSVIAALVEGSGISAVKASPCGLTRAGDQRGELASRGVDIDDPTEQRGDSVDSHNLYYGTRGVCMGIAGSGNPRG